MEMRANKSYTYVERSIGPIIIGAFVSGMGNGSVFGAAAMCWMGRGMFAEWGGGGLTAYDPSTFNGFMTFWMLGFGLAFAIMFTIALKKHYALETAQGAHGTRQSI